MEIGRPIIFSIGGLGILALITGFVLEWYGNGKIIFSMMAKELALTNGSMGMAKWKMPPQAATFKVYIYNVTNPEDVHKGKQPLLSEVGPYVYDQWEEKVDVTEEANDTLSYRLKRTYHFNSELSGCRKDTDIVTVLNFPLVGTVMMVESSMPFALSYLDEVWEALFPGIKNVFITGSVKDILFDGVILNCTSKEMTVSMVCNNLEKKAPETIRREGKNYKFSFFHHKNKTANAVMRIYRGNDDLRKVVQTYSFENRTRIKYWGSKYCKMLNGSDGTQYPVNLDKKQNIYLFQTDLCRSVHAKFEKEVYRDGIKLLRYVNTPDLFASPMENPGNKCYCSRPMALTEDENEEEPDEEDLEKILQEKKKEKEAKSKKTGNDDDDDDDDDDEDEEEEKPEKICLKSGAMLLTPCVKAPVAVSFPHFYMGDSSYMNFTGLVPNKSLHETYAEIEPVTGTPVAAYKRIQFNLEIKKVDSVSVMSSLSSGMFPALWVEEGFTLTEENFNLLKHNLDQKWLLNTITYALIGLGVAFLLLAYTLYAKKQKMCCWESSFSDTKRTAKIEGYDNGGFGANGAYHDKMKTTSLVNNGVYLKSQMTSDGIQMVDPAGMRIRRSPGFRRASNVVSYVENFM